MCCLTKLRWILLLMLCFIKVGCYVILQTGLKWNHVVAFRMAYEMFYHCKLFLTYVTFVWLLSSVCQHVAFKMPCLYKLFITYVIFMWFLSSVCQHVVRACFKMKCMGSCDVEAAELMKSAEWLSFSYSPILWSTSNI